MQAYHALVRRELNGFFYSITGYVIISAFAFLLGEIFVYYLMVLGEEPTPVPLTQLFFGTWTFWWLLLPIVPLITMRLFALEKFSGTFETLMTTRVTDMQVIAAKFTAALIFYLVMWLPLLGCFLVLRQFVGGGGTAFDPGALGSTFLGILLMGCLFLSLGCLASSLTHNQVIAAMIALTFSIGMFLLGMVADTVPKGDWKAQVVSFFALPDHMNDFARGVVDTRAVVFLLTATFFILFLNLRVLESRRWK
jgi:ABC-2 type transport system permease protein